MICVFPPEPDETQLLAYLDGDEAQEVAMHLERCPHCQARARQLASFQSRLAGRLYRAACPTSLDLGEYHLGMLSVDRAAAVARHVAVCPLCSQELAQLQGYLADLKPELDLSPVERAREGARVLVARLTGGLAGGFGLQPALAPAYAGLRGDDEAPTIYTAEDVQVVIEVQADADRADRRAVLGLVTGLADPAKTEAHLWRESHRVATVPLDDLGCFVIGDLAPGEYVLILAGPEVEIHVQELQV